MGGDGCFCIVEAFLAAVLYPNFFAETRSAEVRGVVRLSFRLRWLLRWSTVAVILNPHKSGNDVLMPEKHPNQFGLLTNHFNDITAALSRAH